MGRLFVFKQRHGVYGLAVALSDGEEIVSAVADNVVASGMRECDAIDLVKTWNEKITDAEREVLEAARRWATEQMGSAEDSANRHRELLNAARKLGG